MTEDAEIQKATVSVLTELNNPDSVFSMMTRAKAVDATPAVGKSPEMVDTLSAVQGIQLGVKKD